MAYFDPLPFRPEVWTDDKLLLEFGNCHAYGVGDANLATLFSGVYSEPGCISGRNLERDRANYVKQLIENCEADGATFTGDQMVPRSGMYPVVLMAFTQPHRYPDFHYIRMNSDGTFSEKTFERAPRRLMQSNQVLTSIGPGYSCPSHCTEPYRFVGFANVPRDLLVPVRGNALPDALDRAAQEGRRLAYTSGMTISAATMIKTLEPKRRVLQEWLTQHGCIHIPVA